MGLRVDLRLGVDRAASQVKGGVSARRSLCLQIGGELFQRYLGDNDLVARKRTLTSMACGCSCTFSGTFAGTWTFSGSTRPGFLWRIARQLIDHQGLRAQIAPQRERVPSVSSANSPVRSLSPIKALKSLSVHAVP